MSNREHLQNNLYSNVNTYMDCVASQTNINMLKNLSHTSKIHENSSHSKMLFMENQSQQPFPLPLDMIMISTSEESEMAMIVNMIAAKTNEVISFMS